MVVCEIGNIPPHSVPVVIQEMQQVEEDEEDDIFSDEDSDE